MTVDLRITDALWQELNDHLIRPDGSENGAVLHCGVSRVGNNIVLTAKSIAVAKEGRDYVPGTYGYRALTATFVGDQIDIATETGSAYLAVHNHGGHGSVAFSRTDMDSHERGYPALLQYADGTPVGALVINADCVAGDIWLSDGTREELDRTIVVGTTGRVRHSYPRRAIPSPEFHDRQARMFGDLGQSIVREQTVAVVGLGGVGSMLVEQLARLGVGGLMLVDDDVVEVSNLSRLVGAYPGDAQRRVRLRGGPRHGASRKVDVAARLARRINPSIRLEVIGKSVVEPDVADRLKVADHIFLAADTAQARLVVNAVAHQHVIPATQIGSKVSIHEGRVVDVFSVVRSFGAGVACLNCNGLISPEKLQEEATDPDQLRRQRYVDDANVQAPSVISLNGIGASFAVNAWLLALTGLTRPNHDWFELHLLDPEWIVIEPSTAGCQWCGRRAAVGDKERLPVRMR